jgi:hypothetical protein
VDALANSYSDSQKNGVKCHGLAVADFLVSFLEKNLTAFALYQVSIAMYRLPTLPYGLEHFEGAVPVGDKKAGQGVSVSAHFFHGEQRELAKNYGLVLLQSTTNRPPNQRQSILA